MKLRAVGRIDDATLDTYGKDGTKLGGHPPINAFKDIVFGTGSLGHGLSLATGLALGKKLKKEEGRIFCLCSDGEFQEGSIWEALIFSVHHRLNNLYIIIDVNGWQGFGSTMETASLNLGAMEKMISSFGLQVKTCDGHNHKELKTEFLSSYDGDVPVALLMRTCKGKGVPCFEGQFISHYDKLTASRYEDAIRNLGVEI